MMKTDRYTQIVLTVIALCLCVLTIQNLAILPEVQASDTPAFAPTTVSLPLNPDGTIDVNIKSVDYNLKMPVVIKDIDTYDELNVNLKEVGGSSVSSSSGKLNVKID